MRLIHLIEFEHFRFRLQLPETMKNKAGSGNIY